MPIALSIAAVGVVFGDIGTSPLYSLRACFAGIGTANVNEQTVLGVLSLIFWSLALVISVKYIGIILRADNRGEGGVLALTTLVLSEDPHRAPKLIAILGLIGSALFYGDGVITPAVTVLGAIEGLSVIAPGMQHAVLPLSIVALLWLFSLQRRGTGAIGRLFGPFMVFWFLTLAALGVSWLVAHPYVLTAVNPAYALSFLTQHAGVAIAVLGAVFLAVTGGEALYADLGRFHRHRGQHHCIASGAGGRFRNRVSVSATRLSAATANPSFIRGSDRAGVCARRELVAVRGDFGSGLGVRLFGEYCARLRRRRVLHHAHR